MDIRYFLDPVQGSPTFMDTVCLSGRSNRSSATRLRASRPRRVAASGVGIGRYLKVLYVQADMKANIFVVTAYELTGQPLKALNEAAKRRGR